MVLQAPSPLPRGALGCRLLSSFLALFLASSALASTDLESVSGSSVSVLLAGEEVRPVVRVPMPLKPGARVQTGPDSGAVVVFEDGSKAVLGQNSDFLIEEQAPGQTSLKVSLGRVRTWVSKVLNRRFVVKTPSAVCSVRGTEFQVQVHYDGRTLVDLYKGLLSVTDSKGREHSMTPGQRLDLDFRGALGPAKATEGKATAPPPSSLQSRSRYEVGLDMSKEQVLAAAARELKLAEYQQGKAMIDVNGNRVRLEEYIIRPAPDQFKLVVLNERESRFDYFFYQGTFNKALPADLSVALRQLSGGLDTAPEYFLLSYETGRSNTQDSLQEVAQGGHLVDVNSNGVADDAVTQFFDSAADRYVDATGRAVFQTVFDKYGFYVNGKLKYGWSGNGLVSNTSNLPWSTTNDPITGAALGAALPTRSVTPVWDATLLKQTVYESYNDGTFINWDNYIIDDQGKVGTYADFDGVTTGAAFKQKILGWNYEQVITATEFQGRKIDLVVEPRILIQSGLMP
ncbi:MAG TPA: hypothetical protein DCM05_16800 [Elusimicrobia bacterium]|nr:hypothetical protein [Elusimicrobiota bacterium]